MRVRLDRLDRATWLGVAAASPAATFYATPLFADVAVAADPGLEPAALGGALADGARFAYPLLRRRRRLAPLADAVSTFAGCYGGPLAERPLGGAEAAAINAAVARSVLGELRVVLGPWTPHEPLARGFALERDSTLALDLRGGFDAAVAGFSKGHRRAYHRSLAEGVAVRVEDPARGLAAYLDLYERRLAEWGERATSRYPRATFECLARLARERPDAVRLWFARLDGRDVAGVWAFEWRGRVSLWHGAALDLRLPMVSPQTALYVEIARDAAGRGAELLDFNPSGGHAGPEAFKRRFGADELPVARLRRAPRSLARAAAAARRVARGRPGA